MYGANVFEPEGLQEEDAIRMIADGMHIWLGFNDFRRFGYFVKESNGADLIYSNWAVNTPMDNLNRRGIYHCPTMIMVRIMALLILRFIILELNP